MLVTNSSSTEFSFLSLVVSTKRPICQNERHCGVQTFLKEVPITGKEQSGAFAVVKPEARPDLLVQHCHARLIDQQRSSHADLADA